MASIFSISTVLLLLTFINTVVITAVPEREYSAMLAALRFRGYHLFANAITTTDLHYEIIYGTNFTFFAPIDSALYALDMSMSAAEYTTALRFHGVPHRLSAPDLRMLPYGLNSFPSLVRGHEIHIVNRLAPLMVEGVNIAFPGLFYDAHIAVHGLEGIIDFRSLTHTGNSTSDVKSDVTSNPTSDHAYESITTNLTDDRQVFTPSPAPSPSPQPPYDSTGNQPVAVPVAANAPLSSSNLTRIGSPVPVPSPQTSFVSSMDTIPETNSISISVDDPADRDQSMTYSESTTQGREQHMSMETWPTLISEQINDVSLAAKSTSNDVEEFTEVDDKIVDCPITDDDDDDDGKQLNNIANVRRGYLFTRELYTPSNMTCAQ